MPDVRPKYDRGNLGKAPAEGVFIVGADGLPVDFGDGTGGGSTTRKVPVLEDHSGATIGEIVEFDPEEGLIITPAEAIQVIPFDADRIAGGFFQNCATDDENTVMYCLWQTEDNPGAVATFPALDGSGNPLPNGTFILNAGDSVDLNVANGLSVICYRTVLYACFTPTAEA